MRSFLRWCVSLAIAAFLAAPFTFPPAQARSDAVPAVVTQGIPEIAVAELPREAREMLPRIRRGGPFSYKRDGAVFGNYEKLLPRRERGYYREYTVKTPAAKNRGARRIVAGTGGELYYTDDHYQSFRRIRE
jgi:ribonuclease T1